MLCDQGIQRIRESRIASGSERNRRDKEGEKAHEGYIVI